MTTILIIDDDKDILRLLEFTLKRNGYSVITAKNGLTGLEALQTHKPDLVVCDIMMPKMTGYDFCKRVRANPQTQDIPIIIFSARFQPIDKQTALDAGATDYLPKSTAPDSLVNRIEELLPALTNSVTESVIGVFSLRGGVGATTLAVNLSVALKLTTKSTNIALVDLVVQGGHAAVMLGMRPSSSVAQVLASSKESSISPGALKPHFMKHSSGIELLASPPSFTDNTPASDGLENIVKSAQATFPVVVLDVPHILSPNFTPILQMLDKLILVLTTDMPSLQSTVMALQGLNKLGLTDDKITLVVNNITPAVGLTPETLQKALKRPIFTAIPFEAAMLKAVNSGTPLVLSQPQSPATSAIGQLARTLLH